MSTATPFQVLCEFTSKLQMPIEIDDCLYLVAQNGDILGYKDSQLSVHSL